MKDTTQLFPNEFLKTHDRWLDGKALNVLWWYTQDPEATIQDVAKKAGVSYGQAEHATRMIRREWDSRLTTVAVMKAISELEAASRDIVRTLARDSARDSIERTG